MRRLTIEFVKDTTQKIAEGYKCLSSGYINNKTNLKFVCSGKHQFCMRWADFWRGNRCPKCEKEKRRLTLEFVKSKTKEIAEGYECISEKYVNNYSHLEFRCSNNHHMLMSWSNFSSNNCRCSVCHYENMIGENHPNWKNYTEKDRKDIILYRAEVVQLTNINYKKYFYFINPNKLKRSYRTYHIDHIYSVIDGFNNNISPEIIASPVNLQMLANDKNFSKKGASHMTLEQLYDLYNKFIISIGSEND